MGVHPRSTDARDDIGSTHIGIPKQLLIRVVGLLIDHAPLRSRLALVCYAMSWTFNRFSSRQPPPLPAPLPFVSILLCFSRHCNGVQRCWASLPLPHRRCQLVRHGQPSLTGRGTLNNDVVVLHGQASLIGQGTLINDVVARARSARECVACVAHGNGRWIDDRQSSAAPPPGHGRRCEASVGSVACVPSSTMDDKGF